MKKMEKLYNQKQGHKWGTMTNEEQQYQFMV